MGERWSQFKVAFQWPKISEADAARIADAHNADCDAYEARIAELESGRERQREAIRDREKGELEACAEIDTITAELARVKAESLRVVPDPGGDEWVMTPDGLGFYGADAIGNPSIETPHGYHDFADCKPVRLERWEKEE